MRQVSIRQIASELTREEGLSEQVTVAQVAEILGCLGRRWRFKPPEEFAAEAAAIVARAGARSKHRAKSPKST